MLKKSFLISIFCASSFALGPSPDVVAAIAAQTESLLAALSGQTSALTNSLNAQTTSITEKIDSQTSDLKKEIKDDTEVILKAITGTRDSLNAPNAKIKNLKAKLDDLDKILSTRDYESLLKDKEYISSDYISKYCDKFDEKEKRACFASLSEHGVVLMAQNSAYDDLKEFSSAYDEINKARINSKDIKESADIANAIAGENLALNIYLANKDIAEKTAKAKANLELISAKNQAIDKVGEKINMKELLK